MVSKEQQQLLIAHTVERLSAMARGGFLFLRGQDREPSRHVGHTGHGRSDEPELVSSAMKLPEGGVELREGVAVLSLAIEARRLPAIGRLSLRAPLIERRVVAVLDLHREGEHFSISSTGGVSMPQQPHYQSSIYSNLPETLDGSLVHTVPDKKLAVDYPRQLAAAGVIAAAIETAYDARNLGIQYANSLFQRWRAYRELDTIPLPPAEGPFWTAALQPYDWCAMGDKPLEPPATIEG